MLRERKFNDLRQHNETLKLRTFVKIEKIASRRIFKTTWRGVVYDSQKSISLILGFWSLSNPLNVSALRGNDGDAVDLMPDKFVVELLE